MKKPYMPPQQAPYLKWHDNLTTVAAGARLCEPQRVALPIWPLRVTDPRSVFKPARL